MSDRPAGEQLDAEFESEFARRNALSHALAMAPCLMHEDQLHLKDTATQSLLRHLPSLRTDDRAWVEEDLTRALAQALNPETPAITLALLDALTKLADASTLHEAQRLQEELAGRDGADAARMRVSAARCIEQLHFAVARRRQSQLLLRGANAPTAGPLSTLLRPSGAGQSPAAGELLRSSASADGAVDDEPTEKDIEPLRQGEL